MCDNITTPNTSNQFIKPLFAADADKLLQRFFSRFQFTKLGKLQKIDITYLPASLRMSNDKIVQVK
ncbi:hypothetical protein CWS54_26055 [Klebsiella michiganensis]|nr:hypothetical protein [Klebsiella michiganensis]